MTGKTAISVHGKTYYLKSDATDLDPQQLADFVDNKMCELSKTKTTHSTTDLAILTALNIAGELMGFQGKYQAETEVLQQKMKSLVETLSNELETID